MTLLEALVTVAVLALITALGFPVVQANRAAADWRATQAGLMHAAQGARAEAMRRDRTVRLTVGGDGRSYGHGGAMREAGGAVRLAGGDLAFHPDGEASGAGVAMSDGERRATLRADPDTGRVAYDGPGA